MLPLNCLIVRKCRKRNPKLLSESDSSKTQVATLFAPLAPSHKLNGSLLINYQHYMTKFYYNTTQNKYTKATTVKYLVYFDCNILLI